MMENDDTSAPSVTSSLFSGYNINLIESHVPDANMDEPMVHAEDVLDLSSRSSMTCGPCTTSSGPLLNRPQTPTRSEELISDALKSLSMEERDHVYNEIHGVDVRADQLQALETPQFLLEKLQAFEESLQQIKTSRRSYPDLAALELAEHMDIEFVRDHRLRLAFLRTREWSPKQAASAFVRHLDFKRSLFGDSKLTKIIDVDDLSPRDQKMLGEGHFQILPSRDRSGRAICLSINTGQTYDSILSWIRQVYVMTVSDEETQRRGMLYLSFLVASRKFANESDSAAYPMMKRCMFDMPVRFVAFHFCVEQQSPSLFRPSLLVEAVIHLFTPGLRARIRFHDGSFTEWCYELLTYGVPVHLLPLTMDFRIKTKNHLEYLSMRRRAAEIRRQSNGIIEPIVLPTNRDICLGRGKPIQQSIGNQKLSDFLATFVEGQDAAANSNVSGLADKIVQHVKMCGGRFLSKDTGVWSIASDDLAREKVIHMFRHRRNMTATKK
eukprot:Nitzschia sp. Nitz4//scaffold85_size83877//71501//73153//NITZ4_005240-RA/size83877-augustus-gene-0.154-mRNA-1//1//CDS//3329559170//3650//frame0